MKQHFILGILVVSLISIFSNTSIVDIEPVIRADVPEVENITHQKPTFTSTSWTEGKTIRTSYTTQSKRLSEETISKTDIDDTLHSYGSFASDYVIYVYDDSVNNYTELHMNAFLPAISAGMINYNFTLELYNQTQQNVTMSISGTYNIEKSTDIPIYIRASGSDSNITLDWYCDDVRAVHNVTTTTACNVSYIKLTILDFSWNIDQIVKHIRSDYQYVTATRIKHRINYIFAISTFFEGTLTINQPLTWRYISTNVPGAIVVEKNYNLIITNVDEEIIIFWQSGTGVTGIDGIERRNQFLSISETTENYLDHPSFEDNQFESDFYSYNVNYFDTVALNHTIVSDGLTSLCLTDSDVTTSYLYMILDKNWTNKDLNSFSHSKEFYFSFDYYIESFATGSLYFNYFDATTDTNPIVCTDSTLKNRWHTSFLFVDPNKVVYDFGRFRIGTTGSDPEFIIFLDNVRLYEVNTKLTTVEFNKCQLEYTVINWDNMANNPVSYTETTFTHLVRSNASEIYSEDYTTDAVGQVSVLLDAAELDLVDSCDIYERMNKITCWDSWWGYKSYEAFEDTSLWSSTADSYTESITSNQMKFEITEWGSVYSMALDFVVGSYIDIMNLDYFNYDLYSNETATTDKELYTHQLMCPDYPNRASYAPDIFYTTSKTTYSLPIEILSSDDWSYAGSPNLATIDYLYFYFDSAGTSEMVSLALYFDNLRFIQSQKSYFTPKAVESSVEYFDNEENNALDFTEGAIEIEGSDTESVENGYLNVSSTDKYCRLYVSDLSIDTSYYTAFRIRFNLPIGSRLQSIKNVELGATYYWVYWDDGSPTTSQEWETWEYTFDSDDWVGTITTLAFIFEDITTTTNITLIDYIQLIHYDIPVLYESDSTYYLSSSNNNYRSYALINDTIQDVAWNDLELLTKNQTAPGIYTLVYYVYIDLSNDACYLSYSDNDTYKVFRVDIPTDYTPDPILNMFRWVNLNVVMILAAVVFSFLFYYYKLLKKR